MQDTSSFAPYVSPHNAAGLPSTIRWGAIFAGSIVALGLWAMLYTLGLALGLSTISPDNADSLRRSGLFTGAWSVLSPLLALFCGGIFSSRGASSHTATIGAMHGLTMWALSAVAFAWLFVNLLTAVMDGAVDAGKQAFALGGHSVISGLQGADTLQQKVGGLAQSLGDNLGLDVDDALRPINARLQATGRTPIDPQQMVDAAKNILRRSMQDGKIDRDMLTRAVLENTPLERRDADEIVQRLQAQVQASKDKAQQMLEQAKQKTKDGAYKTADATGKVFWGIFTILFMGMLASVGGGLLGVRHRLS